MLQLKNGKTDKFCSFSDKMRAWGCTIFAKVKKKVNVILTFVVKFYNNKLWYVEYCCFNEKTGKL
jgi:hypothetical protein